MAEETIDEIYFHRAHYNYTLKRNEPLSITRRNDPLEQRKGKESARHQYQREFPADYARKKIAKGNLTPKDEIKASLGKHHKPGHLPEEQINEISAELIGKVSNARFWQGKEIGRAHV